MRVRGLKLEIEVALQYVVVSHPMRVRGLKLASVGLDGEIVASHPMRVRGLKRWYDYDS